MLNYLSINRMSLFLPYLFLNFFNSHRKGRVNCKKQLVRLSQKICDKSFWKDPEAGKTAKNKCLKTRQE